VIIYGYLMKAVQDDARRAAERHRLALEARWARRERRQRLFPLLKRSTEPKWAKIVVTENVTPGGVSQRPRPRF
jgi:hypothetical protein